MRYLLPGRRFGKAKSAERAASEKLEVIRLVEEGHLSARQTLAKLGIPRTTFYRWYDRYLQRGEAGLQDQSPKPSHVWNRVPTEVKRKVVTLALQETELSPRELAVTFTDQERYFVSESTVYRTLKAHGLITSPAFIVLKAANEFRDKTTGINQLPLSSPQAATAGQRADRLHLSQGPLLGLVLSQHNHGRLDEVAHARETRSEDAGYYTDTSYVQGVFPGFDPRKMGTVTALGGRPAPDATQPFTYADFGCGHGLTILFLAQALPNGQFFGIDLMDRHIALAQDVAKRLNVSNVTFIKSTFDALEPETLPPLDFAVAHGVLSWVAPNVRHQLIEFVGNRLKPEGLFQVSYNHVAGWGDLIAARELLKYGVEAGFDDEQIRDLVVSLLRAGAAQTGSSAPRLIRALENKDMNYVRHEFLNAHWTCFTNQKVVGEMGKGGLEFAGPWYSPMQAAEPDKRPLKLQDALFWEDAFCVRKKASFRTAIFQKAHSGSIGLKNRQVLGPGYVTLSPDKALDGSPTLAASSLGTHPPYGTIALRDLSELCAGRQGQVQLTRKLVSRSFVFVDQPVAPNAGIGQYELFKGVADQVKMQNELGLHIHTLALPGKQAVFQLPASIWRVMVLCERKPPKAFSQELTKFTGKSTSAPQIEIIVQEWKAVWAPWLAGLQAIQSWSG